MRFGVWSKASTVPFSHAKQQKPPAPYVCAHQWVHMPYAWMCWCNAFSVPIISLSAQQGECSLVQSWDRGVRTSTNIFYLYVCVVHTSTKSSISAQYLWTCLHEFVHWSDKVHECVKLCVGITSPNSVTGIAGAVCLCCLVTLPKLLGSGISSLVSSFPVMMESQGCAKKRCAWGASLALTHYTSPISKYHQTHTHKYTKQPPGKYCSTQRTPKFHVTAECTHIQARTNTLTHCHILLHLFMEERSNATWVFTVCMFYEHGDIYSHTLSFWSLP